MKDLRAILLFAVTVILLPGMASAGPCDATFNFDGNLSDSSGNGNHGEMIGKGGVSAKPVYVEGRSGQALRFDGTSAMRAPLDLYITNCPQVTISAWVKIDADSPKVTQALLSTGSGSGPGLRISGTGLSLNGPANGLYKANAIRRNSGWRFIAGVYDYEAGTFALQSSDRPLEVVPMSKNVREWEDMFWVGAMNDTLSPAASGIVIDDVRIEGRASNHDQLRSLRNQIPGDHFEPTQIPGDHFEPTQIPGDHFEPTQIPGDHFEPTQIPGDHFEPTQIPGDHFEPTQIPGDHFEPTQIPGDHFEPTQIPTGAPGTEGVFGNSSQSGDQSSASEGGVCTAAQVAGSYRSEFNVMQCSSQGPASLSCCYGADCKNTLTLTVATDGRSATGVWKQPDGATGSASFQVDESCSLVSGQWGFGTASATRPWDTTGLVTRIRGSTNTPDSGGTDGGISPPGGRVVIPGPVEQIEESAEDALPDGGSTTNPVSPSGGRVTMPGPAEQIEESLVDGLFVGRWTHISTTEGTAGFGGFSSSATFEFRELGNLLSGTWTAYRDGGQFGPETEIDEPLTNISKVGRTVSFSSETLGSRTCQVSEDGTQLILQSSDPDAPDPIVYFKESPIE